MTCTLYIRSEQWSTIQSDDPYSHAHTFFNSILGRNKQMLHRFGRISMLNLLLNLHLHPLKQVNPLPCSSSVWAPLERLQAALAWYVTTCDLSNCARLMQLPWCTEDFLQWNMSSWIINVWKKHDIVLSSSGEASHKSRLCTKTVSQVYAFFYLSLHRNNPMFNNHGSATWDRPSPVAWKLNLDILGRPCRILHDRNNVTLTSTTSQTTYMTMERQPFEDVSPIKKKGDVPLP